MALVTVAMGTNFAQPIRHICTDYARLVLNYITMFVSNISKDVAPQSDLIVLIYPNSPCDVAISH